MQHLDMQNPILPIEKTFWEMHIEAVETSGPANRTSYHERILALGIESVAKDPEAPLDLACLATILAERAKTVLGNSNPTTAYKDALNTLNALA